MICDQMSPPSDEPLHEVDDCENDHYQRECRHGPIVDGLIFELIFHRPKMLLILALSDEVEPVIAPHETPYVVSRQGQTH